MGDNCCRNEGKTVEFRADIFMAGNDNTIIDNRANPPSNQPSTSPLSDGSPSERPNTVVGTQDLVIGGRNHISKGQTSKALPPRSCPTDTNGTTSQQENLMEKNDDKDYTHNIEIVAKASRYVGIIPGPERLTGTGFRVVDRCLMPALHVVDNIIRAIVFVMVWIYTYFEDIVYDHRNQISKGQTSKEVRTRSCPTDTNGTTSQQGNLMKKHDDKDYAHNREIVAKASRSVGIIPGPGRLTGTWFRVIDRCIMPALHVIDNIIRAVVFVMVWIYTYFEDIVYDHRNQISKGQTSKEVRTSSCPTDTNDERSNRVYAEDRVHGHRNHISNGQTSKELPPISCPTDTNDERPKTVVVADHVQQTRMAQGNLVKSNNNKDFVRNRDIVVKASRSVGIIRGPKDKTGTGFRVGDCYIMTALHVIDAIIKSIQSDDKEIDYTKILYKCCYIEFGYLEKNQEWNRDNKFGFSDLIYKSEHLDTALLALRFKEDIPYPPPIVRFEELKKQHPVYLIGHPDGKPMMDDRIIYFYDYSEEDVRKSKEWAKTKGIPDENDYKGIDNQKKTLFNCAFQHGASGALGIMVMPDINEPICVLMLLKGFPEFYFSKDRPFSNEEKDKFIIVEQGVLLKSIEDDMNVNSKQPRVKNNIFCDRIQERI